MATYTPINSDATRNIGTESPFILQPNEHAQYIDTKSMVGNPAVLDIRMIEVLSAELGVDETTARTLNAAGIRVSRPEFSRNLWDGDDLIETVAVNNFAYRVNENAGLNEADILQVRTAQRLVSARVYDEVFNLNVVNRVDRADIDGTLVGTAARAGESATRRRIVNSVVNLAGTLRPLTDLGTNGTASPTHEFRGSHREDILRAAMLDHLVSSLDQVLTGPLENGTRMAAAIRRRAERALTKFGRTPPVDDIEKFATDLLAGTLNPATGRVSYAGIGGGNFFDGLEINQDLRNDCLEAVRVILAGVDRNTGTYDPLLQQAELDNATERYVQKIQANRTARGANPNLVDQDLINGLRCHRSLKMIYNMLDPENDYGTPAAGSIDYSVVHNRADLDRVMTGYEALRSNSFRLNHETAMIAAYEGTPEYRAFRERIRRLRGILGADSATAGDDRNTARRLLASLTSTQQLERVIDSLGIGTYPDHNRTTLQNIFINFLTPDAINAVAPSSNSSAWEFQESTWTGYETLTRIANRLQLNRDPEVVSQLERYRQRILNGTAALEGYDFSVNPPVVRFVNNVSTTNFAAHCSIVATPTATAPGLVGDLANPGNLTVFLDERNAYSSLEASRSQATEFRRQFEEALTGNMALVRELEAMPIASRKDIQLLINVAEVLADSNQRPFQDLSINLTRKLIEHNRRMLPQFSGAKTTTRNVALALTGASSAFGAYDSDVAREVDNLGQWLTGKDSDWARVFKVLDKLESTLPVMTSTQAAADPRQIEFDRLVGDVNTELARLQREAGVRGRLVWVGKGVRNVIVDGIVVGGVGAALGAIGETTRWGAVYANTGVVLIRDGAETVWRDILGQTLGNAAAFGNEALDSSVRMTADDVAGLLIGTGRIARMAALDLPMMGVGLAGEQIRTNLTEPLGREVARAANAAERVRLAVESRRRLRNTAEETRRYAELQHNIESDLALELGDMLINPAVAGDFGTFRTEIEGHYNGTPVGDPALARRLDNIRARYNRRVERRVGGAAGAVDAELRRILGTVNINRVLSATFEAADNVRGMDNALIALAQIDGARLAGSGLSEPQFQTEIANAYTAGMIDYYRARSNRLDSDLNRQDVSRVQYAAEAMRNHLDNFGGRRGVVDPRVQALIQAAPTAGGVRQRLQELEGILNAETTGDFMQFPNASTMFPAAAVDLATIRTQFAAHPELANTTLEVRAALRANPAIAAIMDATTNRVRVDTLLGNAAAIAAVGAQTFDRAKIRYAHHPAAWTRMGLRDQAHAYTIERVGVIRRFRDADDWVTRRTLVPVLELMAGRTIRENGGDIAPITANLRSARGVGRMAFNLMNAVPGVGVALNFTLSKFANNTLAYRERVQSGLERVEGRSVFRRMAFAGVNASSAAANTYVRLLPQSYLAFQTGGASVAILGAGKAMIDVIGDPQLRGDKGAWGSAFVASLAGMAAGTALGGAVGNAVGPAFPLSSYAVYMARQTANSLAFDTIFNRALRAPGLSQERLRRRLRAGANARAITSGAFAAYAMGEPMIRMIVDEIRQVGPNDVVLGQDIALPNAISEIVGNELNRLAEQVGGKLRDLSQLPPEQAVAAAIGAVGDGISNVVNGVTGEVGNLAGALVRGGPARLFADNDNDGVINILDLGNRNDGSHGFLGQTDRNGDHRIEFQDRLIDLGDNLNNVREVVGNFDFNGDGVIGGIGPAGIAINNIASAELRALAQRFDDDSAVGGNSDDHLNGPEAQQFVDVLNAGITEVGKLQATPNGLSLFGIDVLGIDQNVVDFVRAHDDDGDGVLSQTEISALNGDLTQVMANQLAFTPPAGQPPAPVAPIAGQAAPQPGQAQLGVLQQLEGARIIPDVDQNGLGLDDVQAWFNGFARPGFNPVEMLGIGDFNGDGNTDAADFLEFISGHANLQEALDGLQRAGVKDRDNDGHIMPWEVQAHLQELAGQGGNAIPPAALQPPDAAQPADAQQPNPDAAAQQPDVAAPVADLDINNLPDGLREFARMFDANRNDVLDANERGRFEVALENQFGLINRGQNGNIDISNLPQNLNPDLGRFIQGGNIDGLDGLAANELGLLNDALDAAGIGVNIDPGQAAPSPSTSTSPIGQSVDQHPILEQVTRDAAGNVTGRILFEDLDGDGQFDPGETSINSMNLPAGSQVIDLVPLEDANGQPAGVAAVRAEGGRIVVDLEGGSRVTIAMTEAEYRNNGPAVIQQVLNSPDLNGDGLLRSGDNVGMTTVTVPAQSGSVTITVGSIGGVGIHNYQNSYVTTVGSHYSGSVQLDPSGNPIFDDVGHRDARMAVALDIIGDPALLTQLDEIRANNGVTLDQATFNLALIERLANLNGILNPTLADLNRVAADIAADGPGLSRQGHNGGYINPVWGQALDQARIAAESAGGISGMTTVTVPLAGAGNNFNVFSVGGQVYLPGTRGHDFFGQIYSSNPGYFSDGNLDSTELSTYLAAHNMAAPTPAELALVVNPQAFAAAQAAAQASGVTTGGVNINFGSINLGNLQPALAQTGIGVEDGLEAAFLGLRWGVTDPDGDGRYSFKIQNVFDPGGPVLEIPNMPAGVAQLAGVPLVGGTIVAAAVVGSITTRVVGGVANVVGGVFRGVANILTFGALFPRRANP